MSHLNSLNYRIQSVLEGQGYLSTDGLADYHATQRVKSALRRREPDHRLSGVREALKRYRVTAWLTSAGKIELRKDGKTVLEL